MDGILTGTGKRSRQRRAVLTARELECLALLARGESGKRIAHSLGISEKTAQHYVVSARQKLCARNAVHAVALAIARGLLGVSELISKQD